MTASLPADRQPPPQPQATEPKNSQTAPSHIKKREAPEPRELLVGLGWRPGHFHYVEGGFYVEEGPASDAEREER